MKKNKTGLGQQPLVDLETGEVITDAIMHHYKRYHVIKREHKPQGEINTLPSRTIPDMAMSIPDMLKRYANGMPINGNVPLFEGEDLLPNPNRMDISEYYKLVDQTRKDIQDIVQKQREKKELALKTKIEQQLRDKWDAEQKAKGLEGKEGVPSPTDK